MFGLVSYNPEISIAVVKTLNAIMAANPIHITFKTDDFPLLYKCISFTKSSVS
ncbi:hypothetical protein [Thalassobellus suaedae]|uniref:Uncharacterized protein n=1 Tax=Thalassobellus suaedae TaxID=3074124 RepID=A0ABY9XTQ0_9FLAO|nr:hypothetical protein RHP51_19575 [Flavobacteriaceae bacterium HL-DH14]